MFTKVDVVVLNKGPLLKKLQKASESQDNQDGIFKALLVGGLMIQSTAVKSIVTVSPGSTAGVRYNKSGTKRDVNVSPPGKPPNADTGRLHQSIRVEFSESGKWVEVGTDLLYGAWLEFGTLTTPARPWLLPAYLANRSKILVSVVKAIENGIKKAIR